MALNKKSLELPIIKGVDTKVDEKQLQIGKLLSAQNCEFRKPGKISKRTGFTNIGNSVIDNGSTITSGQAIMNYKEELLAFDKENIYSYVAGNDAWKDKGNFQSVYATSEPVSNGTGRDYMSDSVYWSGATGDLEAYVYMRQSAGAKTMYYQVTDATTKQIIVGPVAVSTEAFNPKIVLVDDTFVMYYYNTTDTKLYVGLLGTDNLAAPVVFTAITDNGINTNSVDPLDPAYFVKAIEITGQGTNVYLAYNNNASSFSKGFSVKHFSSSDLLIPASSTTAIVGGNVLTCGEFIYEPFANRVYFAFTSNPTGANVVYLYSWLYNLTSQLITSTTISEAVVCLRITGISTSSTSREINLFVDYIVYNGLYIDQRYNVTGLTYASTWTRNFSDQQLTVGGGAFNYNGKAYFIGIGGVDLDPSIYLLTKVSTYFLVDEAGNIQGRYFPDEAAGTLVEEFSELPLKYAYYVPKTNVISDTEFITTARTITQFGIVNGVPQTGIRTIGTDFFEPQKSYSHAEIAQSLYIGGGMLYQYDGGSLVEDSYNFAPAIKNMEANDPGTQYSYQYVAVWEWVDNYGNLHRSQPSDPYPVNTATPIGTGASYTKDIWLFPLGLTLKTPANNRSPVMCVLYRTKDAATGDTAFYRLGVSSDNTNDTSATFLLPLNDGANDTQLIEPLYTSGEEPNIAPPPIGALTVYRNRLFALDSTNPLVIYYSKRVNFASPVEWGDGQILNIDPKGGKVTALAALDDKLIIFKENSIRYIIGQGPNPDGTNDDYGDSILITTDAGCSNIRSIVNTPEGVVFKSSKGIYFIDRGLKVSYIGSPVEKWNEYTVTSAVLMTANNQVRITLDNGIILVYDYFVDTWAVFSTLFAVDSIIWSDRHAFINSTGYVSVQDLDPENPVYNDNGASYPMEITTGWIPFGGIQGFQRLYKLTLLGTFKSEHNLQTQLYYDYNNASSQTIVVSPQVPSTYGTGDYGDEVYGGDFDLYQYELRNARQKCMAVKIKIMDTAVEGTPLAEGYDLSNIRFSYGVIGGANRLRNAQTFG